MTIPVYLINLDRSADRLAAMGRRFADLGIAFERITAIEGRSLPEKQIDALRIQTPGWLPLSAGEVGCFLSHRQCWKQIAHGEEAYGCVFEDDVLLSSRLPVFLSDTGWIPKDAEIVKIEDAGIRVWLDEPLIERSDGFALGRLRSANYRAGGYILSRDSAKRLLSMTERFAIPIDLVLFDHSRGFATQMVIYQLVPALCVQKKGKELDDVDTTIDERGRFERKGFLARQARRYAQEGWKIWHRVNGRRRMRVGFDAS